MLAIERLKDAILTSDEPLPPRPLIVEVVG
jgi:hypothetical protein